MLRLCRFWTYWSRGRLGPQVRSEPGANDVTVKLLLQGIPCVWADQRAAFGFARGIVESADRGAALQ